MLTGLHFVLTYRCTHQCDHCFVHSGPGAPGTFTLEQVRRTLEEAVRIGTVTRVYFEGGEPFLYYPLLLEGLRAAGRLGIPVGAISTPRPEQGEGVRFRGRAADKLTSGLPRRCWREFDECPDEDFADPGRLHVDAYGNVHLCQGILIGNMWRTPLSELARSYDPRELAVAGSIQRGGPAALVTEHGLSPEPDYVSACHLCYRIRERLLDRFPDELGPAQIYGREA